MTRVKAVRIIIALVLTVALCCHSFPAAAAGKPAANGVGSHRDVVAQGVERLTLAVIAGAGIGAVAAAVSGNALAGASLGTFTGTLAALYVAHLFVEAVIVGGVYYFWPWEGAKKSGAAPSGKAIRDVVPPRATLGLRLATER